MSGRDLIILRGGLGHAVQKWNHWRKKNYEWWLSGSCWGSSLEFTCWGYLNLVVVGVPCAVLEGSEV